MKTKAVLFASVTLFTFGCKTRSMNEADVASKSTPKLVKIYQGQLQEPRLWSGSIIFAGEQKGNCKIVQSEHNSSLFMGKNRAISCEWKSRGTENTFHAMVPHSGRGGDGFVRLNDAGFAQLLVNCEYFTNPTDGLLMTCEKSDVQPSETKVSIEHAAGKYTAKVSGFGRGRNSEIKCERKGFDSSDVQNYLECRGSSGNGEPDSFYGVELKFVAGGNKAEKAWGNILYSGSGGVATRPVFCWNGGETSFLKCSIDPQ